MQGQLVFYSLRHQKQVLEATVTQKAAKVRQAGVLYFNCVLWHSLPGRYSFESLSVIQTMVLNRALQAETSLEALSLPLERDVFLRTLMRELAGTLQDVVGLEEASGFISVVGQNMGRQIDQDYKAALAVSQLTQAQVAAVLVDLKRRIQGDFYMIEQTPEKLVLGNRACPFAEKVIDRPAMCMMTSNVFGFIAAENLGYAKVELQATIASGSAGCRVVVYLKPTPEAEASDGRAYFQGEIEG